MQLDHFLLSVTTVAVLAAGLQDLFQRRISDWCTGAMALCAVAYVTHTAPDTLPYHLLNGLVVFLAGLLLFKKGMLGGGDVKMLTALSIFFTRQQAPLFIILTMMAGGVLGAFYLGRTMVLKQFNKDHHLVSGVPYGVAIAAGFSIAVGQLL